MDKMQIATQLKKYIINELLRDPAYKLRNDEALFSSGTIDSFGLAQIGVFIETEFDIFIPDSELTVANMETLDDITENILRRID